MTIDKDFNPGTGNTFNEWHIQHVENLNPNATTVTTHHNHYYGGGRAASGGREKMDDAQKQAVKEAVLDYVASLAGYVKPEWKTKHASLWKKILDLPAVEAAVGDYGRQRNTSFNKYVVGNIIHMLMGKVLEGDATNLCKALEGNCKHRIRQEMGLEPAEDIREAVKKLLEQ